MDVADRLLPTKSARSVWGEIPSCTKVRLRRRPALQGAVEVGKGLIEPKPIKDIAKDAAPITSEPKSAVFSD